MKIYMDVTITNYGMDYSREAYVFIDVDDGKITNSYKVDYTDGLRILARMAKNLGRVPTFEINHFDTSISYRKLSGYLH